MSEEKLYKFPESMKSLENDTFWNEFASYYTYPNVVNLSVGNADYTAYENLKRVFDDMGNDNDYRIHQYATYSGNMRLRKAVSKYVEKRYGLNINPANQIQITSGGNGGLYFASLAFLNEGDEVILFEPFYISYMTIFENSKAKVRYVPLKCKGSPGEDGCVTSDDWSWDDDELEAAFNSKTKLIVVNSPNNPIGKVLNETELRKIVDLCIKYDVICLCDDVYETYVYSDTKKHINILETFPEVRDRALVINSGGKLFAATGLKTGWIYGDPKLVNMCTSVAFYYFITDPNISQEFTARCLEIENERLDSPECFFNRVSLDLKPKRDRLVKIIRDAGFIPTIPDGGFFLLGDFSKLIKDVQLEGAEDETVDVKFYRYLIKKYGLVAYPISKFYSTSNRSGHNYIRFCFVREDECLDKVEEIFKISNN